VERFFIALALVVVAVVVATVIQRRRPQPSRAPAFKVPERLDRDDFDRPDTEWLVAAFTSATCDTCAGVVQKARALESEVVAVQEVEVKARKDLHERYEVDAVPLVLVVDASGEVRRHYFGPVPTSELWAAVADERAGSSGDDEPPERGG
jgi:hypothetical protein